MSSHHIVRDDQEPALILNHPSPDDRVVLQLMEWSPLLVCLPASFSFVEDKQQWVDFFIQQEETTIAPSVLIPAEVMTIAPNEHPDVLRYAMNFLMDKGHQIIHVYSNISDQEMLSLTKEYDKIEIVFFDGVARHIPCVNGVFEKWYPVGQKIKVYPSIEGFDSDDWQVLQKDGFLKLVHSAPFLLSELLNI